MGDSKHCSHIRGVTVLRVIHITSYVGEGTQDDPGRLIDEYWGLNGALLARRDSVIEARMLPVWQGDPVEYFNASLKSHKKEMRDDEK